MYCTSKGMSLIDLLQLVILYGICGVAVYWIAGNTGLGIALKILATVMLFGIAVLMPVWLHNDRKERQQLREDYENGRIDESYYRAMVGEKFFRKHHGEG